MLNTDQRMNKLIFNIALFFMVFLAGLMNSSDFINYLGLSNLNNIISILFYLLLISLLFVTLIKFLLFKKVYFMDSFPYWIVLLFAVLFKFFILFIQNPYWLLPGGKYFYDSFQQVLIITIMVLLSIIISDLKSVKIAIWGLGLGSVFSVLIPFLLFPEMIGTRQVIVQDYFFVGAFWNSAVISYISVGWLMVALSFIETSKIKKVFLSSLFLIMVLGGIAGLSRATLLSVFVSICVYLFFAKKLKKYIQVFLAGIIILAIVVIIFPNIFQNFSERFDNGINIEEEQRSDIWLDYLEDLPNYILFGAIDGDYKKYSTIEYGPHSVLLNWLTQYGILGLLGFLILIYGFLIAIKRVKIKFGMESYSALYAWLTAYFSLALIGETGFKQLTVFAAFGVVLAWGNVSKKMINKT